MLRTCKSALSLPWVPMSQIVQGFPPNLSLHLKGYTLLQDLMSRVNTLDDTVRWARVMSELTEVAGKLCPQTAKSIYIEITQRLLVSSCCTLKPSSITLIVLAVLRQHTQLGD